MDINKAIREVRSRPVIGCPDGCDREEVEGPYIELMVKYVTECELLKGKWRSEAREVLRRMWGNLERYFLWDSTVTCRASQSPQAAKSRLIALAGVETFAAEHREQSIKSSVAWLCRQNANTSATVEEWALRGLLDGSLIPRPHLPRSSDRDDCEGCPTCC